MRASSWTVDSRVQNGDAFDCAALEAIGVGRLVVPRDAVVSQSDTQNDIVIRMRKSLRFAGHPPQQITPESARENMGCASRLEGGALVLATYGEWDSHIEGGAKTEIRLTVPRRLLIERRDQLSGETSIALGTSGRGIFKMGWYVSGAPATGWKAVDSVPDPQAAAESASTPPPSRP